MPVEVKKIASLDFQPRVAIGVALPFSLNGVFSSTYTNKDAVKSNLVNYILTGKRERPLNERVGLGVGTVFFENFSEQSYEAIRNYIVSNIQQTFPQLFSVSVEIEPMEEDNTFRLYLSYVLVAGEEPEEIIIDIQN